MGRADGMKPATQHRIQLGRRLVDYRLVRSRAARKLRIRVGPLGVEVIQPHARNGEDVSSFLAANAAWIFDQLERVERFRGVHRPVQHRAGEILFRGEPTQVRIEATHTRARGNIVDFVDGEIVVRRGIGSQTPRRAASRTGCEGRPVPGSRATLPSSPRAWGSAHNECT